MKKMKLENILHSKGYVSIETLIVGGLIIASGSFMVSKLVWKGKDISVTSNNSLNNSKNILDDNDFNKGDGTSEDTGKIKPNPIPQTDFEYKIIDDDFIQNEIKQQSFTGEFSGEPGGETGTDQKCTDELKSILEREKGTIAIIKYNGTKDKVVVPSEIDGKKVTVISQGAMSQGAISLNNIKSTIKSKEEFLNKIQNKSLSENEIKDCINYFNKNEHELIQEESVRNWSYSLEEKYQIYMGDLARGIGGLSLKNVTLPDTIKVVGDGAFAGNELTNINIKNVEYIRQFAFAGNKFTSIVLPQSVKYIGAGAFSSNQLTNVEFPDSIACVGFNAFLNNKLTDVTISKDCDLFLAFDKNVKINIK